MRCVTTPFPQFLPCLFLLFLFFYPLSVIATQKDGFKKGTSIQKGTFLSIKASEANLRRGPGKMYPIDWVIKRKFYPVQVVQTFQEWYQVIDIDGSKGWISKQMLTKNRHVLFQQPLSTVYKKPLPDAPSVATVKKGVIAALLNMSEVKGTPPQTWCHIKTLSPTAAIIGYTNCHNLWGI